MQGLNTAATLWCSAAIGCQAAAGHVIPALTVTGIVLAVHAVRLQRALDSPHITVHGLTGRNSGAEDGAGSDDDNDDSPEQTRMRRRTWWRRPTGFAGKSAGASLDAR